MAHKIPKIVIITAAVLAARESGGKHIVLISRSRYVCFLSVKNGSGALSVSSAVCLLGSVSYFEMRTDLSIFAAGMFTPKA